MKELTELNINGMIYTVMSEEFKKIPDNNFQTIVEYDKINKRKNLRNKTRENNISFLSLLAKKFSKPFNQITNKELIDYVDSLNVSNSTRTQYIMRIRKFFKWLYQNENPKVLEELIVPKSDTVKKKFSDNFSSCHFALSSASTEFTSIPAMISA